MVSIGSGAQPDEPLGNTDLLKRNFLSLLEFGKKAQNLLSLIAACVCVMYAISVGGK